MIMVASQKVVMLHSSVVVWSVTAERGLASTWSRYIACPFYSLYRSVIVNLSAFL